MSHARSTLQIVGRWALWGAVSLVFLLGLASLVTGGQQVVVATPPPAPSTTWPDDEARAFAVGCARAYLDYDPVHPDRYEQGLVACVSEDAAGVAPAWPPHAPAQHVTTASVARVARVSDTRALITVAAAVWRGKSASTMYLTVPVTHDSAGGLEMDAAPSFTGPPAYGSTGVPVEEALVGDERTAIATVLERFFSAYLSGDSTAMDADVLPGSRITALAVPQRLVHLDEVALAEDAQGTVRVVSVGLQSRDSGDVVYELRYRVRLELGDRWYVAAVNQGGA